MRDHAEAGWLRDFLFAVLALAVGWTFRSWLPKVLARWRRRQRPRVSGVSGEASAVFGVTTGTATHLPAATTSHTTLKHDAARNEAESVAELLESHDHAALPIPLADLVRDYLRVEWRDLVLTTRKFTPTLFAPIDTLALAGTIGLTLAAPAALSGADAAYREAARAAGLGRLNADRERMRVKAVNLDGMPGLTLLFHGRRADDAFVRLWLLRVEARPAPASASDGDAIPPPPSLSQTARNTVVSARLIDASFANRDVGPFGSASARSTEATSDRVQAHERCAVWTDGRTLYARALGTRDPRPRRWDADATCWRVLEDLARPRKKQRGDPLVQFDDYRLRALSFGRPLAGFVVGAVGETLFWHHPFTNARGRSRLGAPDAVPVVRDPLETAVAAIAGAVVDDVRQEAATCVHVDDATGVVHCLVRYAVFDTMCVISCTLRTVPDRNDRGGGGGKPNLSAYDWRAESVGCPGGGGGGGSGLDVVTLSGTFPDGRVFFSDGRSYVARAPMSRPSTAKVRHRHSDGDSKCDVDDDGDDDRSAKNRVEPPSGEWRIWSSRSHPVCAAVLYSKPQIARTLGDLAIL